MPNTKLATLVALAIGAGILPAPAQQDPASNPGQAQTDPTGKPAADTTTNTLVPFRGEPARPGHLHPETDRPREAATTAEKIPVPQGNFASESGNPASGGSPQAPPAVTDK